MNRPTTSVEGFAAGKLRDIGLSKADVMEAGFGNTCSCSGDGARVALHTHYFSGRADECGRQHGHVTDAGTDIEHTLARADAGVAKESFGERSKASSLVDEALVFRFRAAQGVLAGGSHIRHDRRGLYH
jgi:hypothetical protein